MPDTQKTPDANEMLMQLRYLNDLYTQQYEGLDNNIAACTMSNASLQRNIDLLEKSGSIEGSEIIIGGEAGAYIPARLGKVGSVMTYVGGGYLIETDVTKAVAFLKSNLAKGEETLGRLAAEKRKVERDLLEIRYRLNALEYGQAAGNEQVS